MIFETVHLNETASTNQWIAEHANGHDRVVWTDFQTAGRGSGNNTWESAPGQNLLFSIDLNLNLNANPNANLNLSANANVDGCIRANQQFRISMAISLAIVRALTPVLSPIGHGSSLLSIKWPNDIYWDNRKLCGILIENRLAGSMVRESIIGVGLNVNQTLFESNAPNPVSLCQITGRKHDRESLLHSILQCFTLDINPSDYRAQLYRRKGFHPYSDRVVADGGDNVFEAQLVTVEDDGHLLLRDREGQLRRYAFKEVQYVL